MHDFTENLFSGRNKDKMEAFYKKNNPPEGVRVDFHACSGKGLYAGSDFEPGDEIFSERCLVGLQVQFVRASCFPLLMLDDSYP